MVSSSLRSDGRYVAKPLFSLYVSLSGKGWLGEVLFPRVALRADPGLIYEALSGQGFSNHHVFLKSRGKRKARMTELSFARGCAQRHPTNTGQQRKTFAKSKIDAHSRVARHGSRHRRVQMALVTPSGMATVNRDYVSSYLRVRVWRWQR